MQLLGISNNNENLSKDNFIGRENYKMSIKNSKKVQFIQIGKKVTINAPANLRYKSTMPELSSTNENHHLSSRIK